MALIDKASLLMVPSTYEAGKLYNVLPSGNRAPDSTDQNSGYDQTRADFDFDRGSNAAATRVNASGLIEKYRENLLLQSNQFDNNTYWSFTNVSVVSGQAGYDGTNDAFKIVENTASGQHIVGQSVLSVGVVQCVSVYAKAAGRDWLMINQSGIRRTYYDLANGVMGTIDGGVIDATITDVGGGWYRCTYTADMDYTGLRIGPTTSNGANTYTGDGASGILVQNSQLEKSLVATDYLDSTSVTAKAGVLVDLPRINYDANGENGSLLLEPSRQNLVEQSEYHSSTIYGNQNVSIADNATTSPEGFNNAAKIILDSGTNISNGGHYLSFNSTAGTNYTISVFAKAGEYRYFTFTYGSAAAGGGHFDLQEGTLLGTITNAQYSNESASIEDYGNGWYRLIVSLTDNNTISGRFLSMKPSPSASVPSNNNYSSTGDGTSGAYIYGFQLEANASYPSSYIPTMGTSETRAADSCSVTGASDVIGQTEGTLFAEFDFEKLITGNTGRILCVGDNTINNRIGIGIGGNGKFEGFVVSAGTLIAYFQTTDAITELKNYKMALSYKANDFALYINGVQIGTDNSGAVPTGMDKVFVGLFEIGGTGSQPSNGIKQAALFKERLSNAELATLTTL